MARIRLSDGAQDVDLDTDLLARDGASFLRVGDPEHAMRLLQSARDAVRQLRVALAQAGVLDVWRLDDRRVLAVAATRLASGQWRLCRQAPPRPAPPVARGPAPEDAPSAAPLPPPSARRAVRVVHWVEIELVGEDGKPVAHEPYRVTLPDGSAVDGRLDGAGFARLEWQTDGGMCGISFPALDGGAWEWIESAAARARPASAAREPA